MRSGGIIAGIVRTSVGRVCYSVAGRRGDARPASFFQSARVSILASAVIAGMSSRRRDALAGVERHRSPGHFFSTFARVRQDLCAGVSQAHDPVVLHVSSLSACFEHAARGFRHAGKFIQAGP